MKFANIFGKSQSLQYQIQPVTHKSMSNFFFL
jgi:hypothetical protein